MRTEINFAVNFLSNMMRSSNPAPTQLEAFREALVDQLLSNYTDHWFPERPLRGNAYRCMRVSNNRLDKVLTAAGQRAGLSEQYLLRALPRELCVWVDPYEVSYRIGEDGSVGVVYTADNCDTSSEDSQQSTDSASSSDDELTSSSGSRYIDSGAIRISPETVNRAYLIQACDG